VLALWATSRSAAASTPDTPGAVLRLLAADPGALLLAEVDGRVVGALIAASDASRGAPAVRARTRQSSTTALRAQSRGSGRR
jgi:hypothetical protein